MLCSCATLGPPSLECQGYPCQCPSASQAASTGTSRCSTTIPRTGHPSSSWTASCSSGRASLNPLTTPRWAGSLCFLAHKQQPAGSCLRHKQQQAAPAAFMCAGLPHGGVVRRGSSRQPAASPQAHPCALVCSALEPVSLRGSRRVGLGTENMVRYSALHSSPGSASPLLQTYPCIGCCSSSLGCAHAMHVGAQHRAQPCPPWRGCHHRPRSSGGGVGAKTHTGR